MKHQTRKTQIEVYIMRPFVTKGEEQDSISESQSGNVQDTNSQSSTTDITKRCFSRDKDHHPAVEPQATKSQPPDTAVAVRSVKRMYIDKEDNDRGLEAA